MTERRVVIICSFIYLHYYPVCCATIARGGLYTRPATSLLDVTLTLASGKPQKPSKYKASKIPQGIEQTPTV